MDEWHVGDPADWGDFVGVPDIAYMGYLNDDEEDYEEDNSNHVEYDIPVIASAWAWRCYKEGKYEKALDAINNALDYDNQNSNYLNTKGIILAALGRYDEANKYYNMSLAINWSEIVVENKVSMIKYWAEEVYQSGGDYAKLANLLEESIKELSNLTETEQDIESYKELLNKIQNRIR